MQPLKVTMPTVDPWAPDTGNASRWLSEVALHTHNGVVITDARGLAVWVNPAFEQMTGYALSDLLGKKPGEVLQGPDTDPATVRLLRDRLRARTSIDGLEILNYTRQGRPYWIKLDITPVTDASGELSHFVAIQTPLESEHTARVELNALQQRYRLAVVSSGVGVWEYTPGESGPALDEQALCCVLGITPSAEPQVQLTGLPWTDLPRVLSRWRLEVQRVVGTDARFELEVFVDGVDDAEPRAIRVIGQAQPQLNGKVSGVVMDRTEALKHRLKEQASQLEAMLKIERREAFGRLRRDLRMPMNSLLGFVQLLRHDLMQLGQSTLVDRVERVESAGEQLLQLLDEVLAAGASEAERETQLQPVLLRDALLRLLPHEIAADLTAIEGEAIYVWVDPILLRRALSVVTDVRSSIGSMADTTRLVVAFSNDRSRVHLHFEVETAAPEQKLDGSLRIELLRRLIESMGGQVKVSPTARGQRMTVELRRSLGVTPARSAVADPVKDVWQRRLDVSGRVLYVEDDPGNVELVRHALVARPGVELLVAPDAPSALKLLANSAIPDLVLLDLVLPGISGLALLKMVRADSRYRDLPCVVLTAIDESGQEEEARVLGANDYLTKPLRLNQLLARVDRYLGEAPAGAAVA